MPHLKPIFSAICAATAAISISVYAQDFSKTEIKAEKLSATTYVLFGSGGNIGVSVGDDALFLVDDQYAPLTPKILAALKAISDKPVKFVLNTHWHGDHSGGNENMAKAGAVLVSHDNARKRMSSEQFSSLFKNKTPPSPKAALAQVTFSSDVTFHINGDEVQGFHVPKAHTDGDTIVHFKNSNVIHMGDTFFNGWYPFIDVSGGGSVEGIIACADKVLAMANDATKIIPGHGPISGKAELKAYRDMITTVNDRVKALLKAGKKLEEIQAAKPSAEYDERWGKMFMKPERFVEMLVGANS